MAKTYTFDVGEPANSKAPSGGAAAIRLLKNALHERNDIDHYWEKAGDTADVDAVGYHRKATLMVQATAPTAVANAGVIYSKDVSGKAELFYRDEDGDEVQLTTGGLINVAASFSSGDLLMTTRTGAISGWTDKSTTYAGKYLRIGATALATGGAATHTHTGPSHTHTVSWSVTPAATANPDGYLLATGTNIPNIADVKRTTAQSSITSAAGGTGNTGSGVNTPVYIDVRMYQKD